MFDQILIEMRELVAASASFERTANRAPIGKLKSMRRSLMLASLVVASVALLGACTQPVETKPGTTVPVASPVSSPVADIKKEDPSKIPALVGEWPGQQGAVLKVEKKGEKYEIEIKTKDGSKKFEGVPKGNDAIEFTRNGKVEVIKAATLDETGMKWAGGEKTCVVINKGTEAFCKK